MTSFDQIYMLFDKTEKIKITTLDLLIEALFDGEFDEVIDQSKDFKFSQTDLEKFAHWNKNHYTRNCIARNDSFELILLCWEPGHKTAIHCHNEQECFVNVVMGGFKEVIYSFDKESEKFIAVETKALTKHEITSVDDQTLFHRLENTYKGRSMSLHLYMKPIEKCRFFNEETDKLQTVVLSDYSFEGVLCEN